MASSAFLHIILLDNEGIGASNELQLHDGIFLLENYSTVDISTQSHVQCKASSALKSTQFCTL